MNYKEKVHKLYWEEDVNYATTLIRILAERFQLTLDKHRIADIDRKEVGCARRQLTEH